MGLLHDVIKLELEKESITEVSHLTNKLRAKIRVLFIRLINAILSANSWYKGNLIIFRFTTLLFVEAIYYRGFYTSSTKLLTKLLIKEHARREYA